jgi:protein CLEC16A
MFGVTSSDKEAAPTTQQVIDNRFSLVELRRIHAQLVENKSVTDKNLNLVIEILRVLAEMVVYGDRKSELLFDYFCEKNMLQLFLQIIWAEGGCPASVHVQILQTLSILISSVKNDTSLYYLLSNNHINDVLVFPYDMSCDESLCAQYVSFIKTLSLRLNEQTVQFFFIEDTSAFPILTKSVELLRQKDPMVRISAQSAILNVYKVKEHRSRQFSLQEEVMTQLFQAIVDIMKDQVTQLCILCISYVKYNEDNDESNIAKLEQNLGDYFVNLEDWLYYIQDLLSLNIDVFSRFMIRFIVDTFVGPELLQSCIHLCTETSEGKASYIHCCYKVSFL